MDIGLNWNEWHQEAARKPYVRVGVTLLSGALILMSAQEIVSLYLEKNLISEIEVCATTEDINVSGNDLPEKVTITKQIKEPEKMDEHSFLSAETIQTDVNQADVIQVAAVPAEILVEEPMVEEIARGALSGLGSAVEEIEIPANITNIQPGAFVGLSNLGWIEADAENPAYVTVDGVLYTADGTVLLAFPAAWTGTFQVPESVKSFAESAFDGTNLECIDARSCTLEQAGSIPETVKLLE